MPATNLTRNHILNYNFGATGYAEPPATMYFGLSKSILTATDTSTGSTGVSELTLGATGYERGGQTGVSGFPNNKTNWSGATGAQLHNETIVQFPKSTGVWGVTGTAIQSVFITDGATGVTDIWWYSTLNPSIIVPNNTQLSFPAGAIVAGETGFAGTTLTLDRIMNYHFGATGYDPDEASTHHIYFGLSTTEVTKDGITTVTEPLAASGYARVGYDNNKTTWSTSSGSTPSLYNNISITFPKASASWGEIRSIFIADVITRHGGNILWFKSLSPSAYIQANTIYGLTGISGFAIDGTY
jgi:hypothetical protein